MEVEIYTKLNESLYLRKNAWCKWNYMEIQILAKLHYMGVHIHATLHDNLDLCKFEWKIRLAQIEWKTSLWPNQMKNQTLATLNEKLNLDQDQIGPKIILIFIIEESICEENAISYKLSNLNLQGSQNPHPKIQRVPWINRPSTPKALPTASST
jgi:hypothetical protein